MTFRDLAHRRRGKLKGLVPVDPLPTGMPIALWPSSLERVCQSVRVIDQLGRSPTLRAKRLAGWVSRVRMERDEAAILNFRDAAAARDAQSAIAVDPRRAALCSGGVGDAAYCPRMPAALMIGHHLSISALCNRPRASGACWSRAGISCPRSARC